MNDMKAGPIAGIVGLVALIGVTVTMLRPSSSPLPQQVDDFLEASQKETSQERHADLTRRIDEVQALVNDATFDKLPVKKQDAVRAHLTELTAYRSFVEQLDKITPPRDLKKDEQLREVKSALTQLQAPIEYQVEWSQTEAGQRQRQWLADIDALEKEVDRVAKGYQTMVDEARKLDPEGANLPQRARKILDEARKLPTPEADRGKMVPGSTSVTYATVFAFSRVDYIYDLWKKQRERLQGIAALGKS